MIIVDKMCGKHCLSENFIKEFIKVQFTGINNTDRLYSLVPRLSLRTNEKSKERGEPGRIYHVRNVMGRENLITCGTFLTLKYFCQSNEN